MEYWFIALIILLIVGIGLYLLITNSDFGKFFNSFLGAGDALLNAATSILKFCGKNIGSGILCGLLALGGFIIVGVIGVFIKKLGIAKNTSPENKPFRDAATELSKSEGDLGMEIFNEFTDESNGSYKDVMNDDTLTDKQKTEVLRRMVNRKATIISIDKLEKSDKNPQEIDSEKAAMVESLKGAEEIAKNSQTEEQEFDEKEEEKIEEKTNEIIPIE